LIFVDAPHTIIVLNKMMYSLTTLMLLLPASMAFRPSSLNRVQDMTRVFSASNSDMFGGGEEKISSTDMPAEMNKPVMNVESATENFKSQAAKLRQEAAELEVAMREEARAKGLSEEMINKLIPIRSASSSKSSATAVIDAPVQTRAMTKEEIQSKLGYLNSGDAVRFTSELDRIRSKGIIKLWNSKDVSKLTKIDFQVSNGALKNKAKIEAVKLKLDDVGFAYQNVLVGAIVLGTVFGLLSTQIGGQIGFFAGYASALLPILLVGVGSIAPALIGDVVNRFRYVTDAIAKDKYITQNAAKFLVGYCSGENDVSS
jgi:hypothetical protein